MSQCWQWHQHYLVKVVTFSENRRNFGSKKRTMYLYFRSLEPTDICVLDYICQGPCIFCNDHKNSMSSKKKDNKRSKTFKTTSVTRPSTLSTSSVPIITVSPQILTSKLVVVFTRIKFPPCLVKQKRSSFVSSTSKPLQVWSQFQRSF